VELVAAMDLEGEHRTRDLSQGSDEGDAGSWGKVNVSDVLEESNYEQSNTVQPNACWPVSCRLGV